MEEYFKEFYNYVLSRGKMGVIFGVFLLKFIGLREQFLKGINTHLKDLMRF
jgi:hypothetical protein